MKLKTAKMIFVPVGTLSFTLIFVWLMAELIFGVHSTTSVYTEIDFETCQKSYWMITVVDHTSFKTGTTKIDSKITDHITSKEQLKIEKLVHKAWAQEVKEKAKMCLANLEEN